MVAFLSKWPLSPGHTLIVPRKEVDHWIDLERDLWRRVMEVAQAVGKGVQRAFRPAKVGMLIAGLEVRHVHVHLCPMNSVRDLDYDRQITDPTPQELDDAAAMLRSSLLELGHSDTIPPGEYRRHTPDPG